MVNIIDYWNEIYFKIDYMNSYLLEIVNIMPKLHKIIFINQMFELNQELELENFNSMYINNCNQTNLL